MAKYIKVISQLGAVFLLIALQLSFISALPGPFFSINFILILIILVVMFSGFPKFIFWSLYAGFLVDIFTFGFFGLFMITFLITTLTIYFLQINFLTNRSVYSFLALTILGTLIFNFSFQIIELILSFFSVSGQNIFILSGLFWQELLYQLFFHGILAIIIFYFFSFTTRRFRPELLERK